LLSGARAVITNYDSSSAMDSASVSTMLIRNQGSDDIRFLKTLRRDLDPDPQLEK
jgi:hypothetical protein